jgi:hypothetical protein
MGRRSDYEQQPRQPAPDASQRLAETLLAGDLVRNARSLSLRFDSPSEAGAAYRELRMIRDAYSPPRK